MNINIPIVSEKYKHNIKNAYFEVTEDILKLRNLNIYFRECQIRVNITLQLDDDNTAKVIGIIDENINLNYIVSDYYEHTAVYDGTFTDSTLCAIQHKIKLCDKC